MKSLISAISVSCLLVVSGFAAPAQNQSPLGNSPKSGNTPPMPASSAGDKPGKPSALPSPVSKEQSACVVRVNVTDQAYDFMRPWSKRAPISLRALGVVLPKERVLVTGELVANASYVELERPEDGQKVPAQIELVDYQANLAVLKPEDPAFLNGFKPIEIADAKAGDHAAVWQLESTGALLTTSALVTTVEVSRYPIDDTALLLYRLTTSLQYRDGSFTVPVTKDGKLIGLLMRYDPRSQNADVIPSQVILHFLKDADSGSYHGFPKVGFAFAPMRDGQLRRYVGLNNGNPKLNFPGGVFVTNVQKDGPAAHAGIETGDVLLKVDGKEVDQDGNYIDPLYGKLSIVNLISTHCFEGDSADFEFLRSGQIKDVSTKVSHTSSQDSIIEPFTIDRAPRYYVLGGLVLQELSRQYLKEWGDWTKKAPEQFLYYDRYQDEVFQGDSRKRIVILTQVLPSECTIGYEDMAQMVVSKINDVPLTSLADVETALKKPINGFHKIEFDDSVRMIFLDAKQVADQEHVLLNTYGIPSVKRL